jgi:hypothetical protein
LQENPELGEFRIHAALKQVGIDCHRALYGLPRTERGSGEAKPLPFKAVGQHQVLDGRRPVPGPGSGRRGGRLHLGAREHQPRGPRQRRLAAAGPDGVPDGVQHHQVRQHRTLGALVSDGGAGSGANQAQQVDDRLGIAKLQIERRQAWQSSIETQFNVQRRMADWHVARAAMWADLVAAHDRWVVDFNDQAHWAHRERDDGRQVTPEELHRIFSSTRFGRRLTRAGYARFRYWRLSGERGLRPRQGFLAHPQSR